MRFFITHIFSVLMFMLWAKLSCIAQGEITFGREFKIYSEVLKEERHYFVRLPASYENDPMYTNKRYPVLVLLDADSHILPVCGLVKALSENDEIIPELIVVGIRNTERSRDMTPSENGKDATENAFARFIENELLKEIDKRYRTQPFRVLAGHSLAGLFAIDCFLNERSFSSYISIDPSLRWSNEAIVRKAQSSLPGKKIRASLYTAQSKNPFDTSLVDRKNLTFRKFKDLIENSKINPVPYKNEYFENEDHFSIPSIAFYKAFLFVFDGFKIPLHASNIRTTSDVVDYYSGFQKRMGAKIAPPGKFIDQVANFLLNENAVDRAIEIMKANENFFPESFVVHQSLGNAFRIKGDRAMAKYYYSNALRLNPGNDVLQNRLKELGQ